MKVLIINSNWGGGGPGGIASDLYHVLSEKGHDVTFAYGRGQVPANVKTYKIGNKFSLYLHALMSRLFDKSGFGSYFATKKFIKFIKKNNPDIINLHNELGYYLNVKLFLKFISKSNRRLYWTLHDCWALTGRCITGLCDNYSNKCGNCPRKDQYPKTYFDFSRQNYKIKFKMFSKISSDNLVLISPSKWLKNLVLDSFIPSENLHHIPNGIDLNVFKPLDSDYRIKYNLENKKVLLAVASSWEVYKGLKYLLELLDLLDDTYTLVIIGKVHEEEQMNNPKIIHINRTENREELVKWYSLADVFVNPTVGDNFPTVNIEALACGTPVVTFDTGGSPESIGNCGAVVKQKDIVNFKKAVDEVINSNISKEECVAQSKFFNKDDRYNDYLNLFMDKEVTKYEK